MGTGQEQVLTSDGAVKSGLDSRSSIWTSNTAVLIYMALGTVILHAIVGNRYGFHRDELATLDDARHLAWGYPAYPPVTPFFGRISLILFGTSLSGFRFFASLAHGATVVLAGLMARDLGGKRNAQFLAGAVCLPYAIGGGALMQYVSFDFFAWVLTAYFMVRLLKTENPRWWIAIGASIGFGMLSKYAICFFVAGIVVGLLFTDARRYLKSKWLWIGIAVALLMFLPNLLWQVQHQFASLDLLRVIHARDVRRGDTNSFLRDQLRTAFLPVPLVLAGLYFYFFSRQAGRFRIVGWMYAITLLIFAIAKAKSYYLYPAYPMIYAGGAVWVEGWLATLRHWAAVTIWSITWTLVACVAIFIIAFNLPIAPVNSRWFQMSLMVGQPEFRAEFGWPEMVQEVARIRDSLAPEERAHLGILADDTGEAGAVNLYGTQYGLPRAISGINSNWQRGYGNPPPQTLIVVGQAREAADRNFAGCRLAGHLWDRYGVKTDEMGWSPDIFVCGPPRSGWPEFWKHFKYYG
ncbi:MAG TPA: glycosyltransferase family 39 protein [Methylomirabilota bacterium]|nr:glycosyltransferase family 39 protein [Methylomirabilota bacterium]